MTLVEVLMAVGVSSLVFAAVATQMFSSGRSFAALANYVALDSSSRNALDTMTKEIRQADRLTNYSPTELRFDTINGPLGYKFEPSTRTLARTFAGQTATLLTEVDSLQFSMFQRNPVGGSVDQYSTTDPSLCKVVQVSWSCSRQILGKKATTESVQSAKVVIRKE
jgi:Tfp pilus assembly protein PilW